ncbi:MAG: hypothetical protein K2M95_03625, partial [Clostridiales bacterium]|nr:hypothetical protein [Clostridiales bacterium]
VIDIVKDLIGNYKYEISTHKYGILGLYKGTKIQLNETITERLWTSIVTSLNNEFGVPVYVHSYYGLIWNKDGKYIACNIIEEIYGSDFMDIFLFDKIPLGRKLPYKEYGLIDGAIKQVFGKFDFNCNTFVNYNRDGFFVYIVSNEKMQWLLQLKGKNLTCYFSDVSIVDSVTKRVTPHYWCKKRVSSKSPETIKNAMEQSFLENAQKANV